MTFTLNIRATSKVAPTVVRPADPEFLSREEAAAALGVSVSTLAHRASAGDGPIFVILGRRAWYRDSDLQAWVEAQTVSRRGGLK